MDDRIHAPSSKPLVGVCGTRGTTSAWGMDLTCHDCMREVVRDPLLLLVNHGRDASGRIRHAALLEASSVWARLWEVGEAEGLRAPRRSDVSLERAIGGAT